MDFAQRELSEFVGYATSNVANNVASGIASAEKLQAFEASLRSMLESASKDSSEEFQKNLIAQFLRESFGYDCNVYGRADLAIYDEGKAKVLFEVKSTTNKAEFVKSPQITCHTEPLQKGGISQRQNRDTSGVALSMTNNNAWSLESKAFYESILYYLREVKREKNNNLKHIILCTAQEFYIIKAQTYHALFVANADKAIQKRIDSAYKNCDFKQGNDTSTARFYTEIESIVREMDNTLEFTYANIPALLGEGLGERLGDNERERERE